MSMPMLRFRSVVVAALLTGATVPASAQSAADVVGEDYHVEVSFNFWKPTPEPIVSSESLGIIGSDINLVTDLGIESRWLKDFSLVLRPATKHRFRIDYLGLSYEAESLRITADQVLSDILKDTPVPESASAAA